MPYGALSLKSSMPFGLDGSMLGLYIASWPANASQTNASSPSNASAVGDLGDLELQVT